MRIQIKNRWTQAVIYEGDAESLKELVLRGVKSGANLSGANLSGANLSGAHLRRANLSDADLSDANLRRADLSGANLSGAHLSGANLSDANLSGANLSDANLSGADLRRANLSGAHLRGANLSDANLSGASIDGEKITNAPITITGLRWWVLITDGYLRIGCQRHTHQEWSDFCDGRIDDMDSDAAEFWARWKEPLLVMCKAHAPAKAQGAQA